MSGARRLRLGLLDRGVGPALAGAVAACCLTLGTADTRADDKRVDKSEKAVCLDAMSKGQTLRDAHKLIEARDRFRTCARQVCPTLVQNDCGGWLSDVERTLPTVVLTARSSAGVDLFAVKVSLDGQPLVTSLDGQAVPINPGLHTFHFEAEGMVPLDRQALMNEGGKEQVVAGVLAPVAPPVVVRATVEAPAPARSSGGTPVRTVGWVLTGVGVAGLAVGAVGGVLALTSKSSDCGADGACAPAGEAATIQRDAHISTIGFAAGGALLAAGLGMVLFGPRTPSAPATALRLVPFVPAAPPAGHGAGGASAGVGIGSSF